MPVGRRDELTFPGGSKRRVNRAGEAVRRGDPSAEDLNVVEEWRSAHRAVLNTFQAILRFRTRDREVTVAQRHKRRKTIFEKLTRFPEMQLARMDDVAGCRLIFPNRRALEDFRAELHQARFHHARKNSDDKYDYIKFPKATGYRGIHDVYAYDVNSQSGRHLKGLLVEIQYRTQVQHAWATAVEVIGHITDSQPKFEQGDSRYGEAMAIASELLARAHERCRGPFPEESDEDIVRRFLEFDQDLRLIDMLRGLNSSELTSSGKRNAILIFHESGELEVRYHKNATDALAELFELEETKLGQDIVLVRADTSAEVRFAFKNYFSDAQDFVRLIDSACAKLSGRAPKRKVQRQR